MSDETTKRRQVRAADIKAMNAEWQQFQRELAFKRFVVRLVVAAFLFAGVALGLLLWWALKI